MRNGGSGLDSLWRGLRRHGLVAAVAVFGAVLLDACGGGGESQSAAPPPLIPPAAGLVSSASAFPAGCGGVPDVGTLYVNAEVEPYAAINPTNPANLIGTWQQDRWSNGGAQGIAIGYSMDGGMTWTRRALPVSRCGGGNAANGGDFQRASDPWVTFAPDGTAYQLSLALSGAVLAPGSRSAVLVSRSADGGRTWGESTTLIRDGELFFNDKPSITADPTDSRYVYAVWDRASSDNRGPTMFAHTADGGATWESARPIYDPGSDRQTIGNIIAVLPDGTLVDFFTQLDTASTGVFAVLRSTDKGASWSAPIRIAEYLGIGTRDPETGAAIRDSGFIGQISAGAAGQLFVVWQDARFSGGSRDGIAFSRSGDGGITWSAPLRINADPAVQALVPSVNVRADGMIGVSYYDMRSNTADPATLLVDYWLAFSRDGLVWNESRIAPAFDLAVAPVDRGYFLGDYQSLASSGGNFFPFYVRTNSFDLANRTDVFVTPVRAPLDGVAEASVAAALARPLPTPAITREHRQKVQQAIVRKLEQRMPGWAARVRSEGRPQP